MATGENPMENATQLKSNHLPASSTDVASSPSVRNAMESFPNDTPNHLTLATMIMLHAYQLHRDDEEFNFTITMNDSEHGKFDDVVVDYTSAQSKSALFIETKNWHRPATQLEQRKERIITKKALMSTRDADDLHSIAKYFISFLNIDKQSSAKDARYVVCTNAWPNYAAECCLNELVPEDNDILSFTSDLCSTYYQLDRNKLKRLDTKLNDSCLEALGQLMASHIFHHKLITHENRLLTLYADFIKHCVEIARDKPNACYQFTSDFHSYSIHGYSKSMVRTFRRSLESAYQKLSRGTRVISYQDVAIMIGKTFFQQAADSTTADHGESPLAARIADFCQNFILVCCPSSEKSAYTKTLWNIEHLSKTAFKMEQETIFIKLRDKLTDAMQKKTPIYPQCVESALKTTMLAENVLKITASKYLQSLKEQCSMFVINPERLEKTGLYENLTSDSSSRILHYRGSSDVMLNTVIISQTLALAPSCEAVFIESINPEITKYLVRILTEPSDVFQSSLIAITFAHTLDNATLQRFNTLMTCNSEKWKYQTTLKILLWQQSIEDPPILVRDLTSDCRQELFERHAALHLFGTCTPLSVVVLPTDTVAHLKYVLDISNGTPVKENVNINQLRYEKIQSWYIPRDIDVLDRRRYCKLCDSELLKIKDPRYFEMDSFPFHQFRSFTFIYSELHYLSLYGNNVPRKMENDKMIMLVGESGAGKTTYFTWLAWHLLTQDPLLHVMHLNVAECGSYFEWLAFNYLSKTIDSEFIRTLFRLSHLARSTIPLHRMRTDRKANMFAFAAGMVMLDEHAANAAGLTSNELIEMRLFREKINRKQVVFMLDGVENIEPRYTAPVLEFVERLSHFEGVQKIFLSTNRFGATSVGKMLPTAVMYQLERFSKRDAERLLHSMLLSRWAAYRQCDGTLQTQLLPFLRCVLDDSVPDCHGNPLLLYMAYSLYLPVLKRCVNFKEQRVHGSIRTQLTNIDSLQLIRKFSDEKLHGCAKFKMVDMTNKLKRDHALLATCTVFGKQYTDRLLTDSERAYVVKLKKDCNTDMMKAGFITINLDGMPRFANRIFAEYFAACWMFANRSRLGSKRYVMLLHEMFAEKSFATIRNMFDRIAIEGCAGTYGHSILCSDCPHRARIFYQFIDRESLEHIFGKDATGRTLLHWVFWLDYDFWDPEYGSGWKALLEIIPPEQIDAKDELFHWSVLDYAFYAKRWGVIREFIKYGAKIDIDVWLNQLCSYDLVELFNRMQLLEHFLIGCHRFPQAPGQNIINDSILARHVLSAISKGLVKHLIYEKDIDICRPLAELDSFTVLEHCVKLNLFGLLEHFVSCTDSPNQFLDHVGHRLFELSVQHKAYRVALYLTEQCGFQSNLINQLHLGPYDYDETSILLFTMELRSKKLFRLCFNDICEKNHYPCIKDEEIVEELCKSTISKYRSNHRYFNFTSLRHADQRLIKLVKDIISEALYQTSFHMINYIVQKLKLSFSHDLLADIIKTLGQQTRVLPEASTSIFNYLLDRTNDLHSKNCNGRTLLHMAGSIGCVVMVQCLLRRGFDPLQTCGFKKQNVFHYIASTVEDQRTIEIFHQLRYSSIDQLNVPNQEGNSVCDIAIMGRKYRLARMLIHTKANDWSTQKRMSAVLDSFKGLLNENTEKKNEILNILKFLTSSHRNSDHDWKDVYDIIIHQIPVI